MSSLVTDAAGHEFEPPEGYVFEPGDTVRLEGAKAERLLRESGLNPGNVEYVQLTRVDNEGTHGAGRWHMQVKYESNQAMLNAHGISETLALTHATYGATPDCYHRPTSLLGLILTDRLVRNGRLVPKGATVIDASTVDADAV